MLVIICGLPATGKATLARALARQIDAEIVCSDTAEHRHRAEHRTVDIPDLALPSWDAIVHRDYEPWHREHIVIDTAGRDVAACVTELRRVLSQAQASSSTW